MRERNAFHIRFKVFKTETYKSHLMLELIGRNEELFITDIDNCKEELFRLVSSSKFLVLGGAGSIGQAVVKEIFKRNPN